MSFSQFQTFEFDVPWEQIRDCSLDISVMDFDTIGRNEMIGRLVLGSEYLSQYILVLIVGWGSHYSVWDIPAYSNSLGVPQTQINNRFALSDQKF